MVRVLAILLLLVPVVGCIIDTVPLPEGTAGDSRPPSAGGDDGFWNGGGGDWDDPSAVGDPGEPPAGECLAAPGTDGDTDVLRFEADAIAVTIARRFVSAGVGESVLYDLEEMRVATAGACVTITDSANLEYENSHHNWLDRAVGTAGGVRYELRIDFVVGTGWQPALVATDVATSAVVVAETALVTTGGPLLCWTCPSHLPVVINEVCTANSTLLADGAGDFDAWVELFNPSSGAVDLSGYSLVSGARAWAFPASTLLGSHAYALVWLDAETGEAGLHADFALSAGQALQLVGADGTSPGERVMTATLADESLVLDPTANAFVVSDAPTPGAANPGGL